MFKINNIPQNNNIQNSTILESYEVNSDNDVIRSLYMVKQKAKHD